MAIKDLIVSKCHVISAVATRVGRATLDQDEQAYTRWDRLLDKVILELIRMIRNDES